MAILSQIWQTIQGSLFPYLEEELGPLTDKEKQLVSILELIRIEEFVKIPFKVVGRKRKERFALARAFVGKSVYKFVMHTNVNREIEKLSEFSSYMWI